MRNPILIASGALSYFDSGVFVCIFDFLTDNPLHGFAIDLLLCFLVNAFTLSISAKQTYRVSAEYLSFSVFILLYEICLDFAVQELLLIFCLSLLSFLSP